MIHLTAQSHILFAIEPADFRAGIDGFIGRCQQQLKQDSRSGTLFVFTNKARTMVRVLVYEDGGYWLMSKRLSQGKFPKWSTNKHGHQVSQLIAKQLVTFLRGEPCAQLSNRYSTIANGVG